MYQKIRSSRASNPLTKKAVSSIQCERSNVKKKELLIEFFFAFFCLKNILKPIEFDWFNFFFFDFEVLIVENIF